MSLRLKTLSLSLCLLGLNSTVFAQPVLIKSQNQIEEYQLENGFKVILAPNPKESQVFMNTVYFTGSLNDPQKKGGMAHLLEHLAFKGTTNIPEGEFMRRLNQYTLSTNASTDYYSTKYTNIIRPESQALEQVIQLEAERMDKLVLQEKYVPAEIDIVKREREIRLDQPFSVLVDQVFKNAYGNQYLGRLPIGDLDELQSINMQELQKFYKDWYMPNNAVMVISGKFDKDSVLKSIDQHFSPLVKGKTPAQTVVPALDVASFKQNQFKIEKGSDLAQFHLYLDAGSEAQKIALAMSPGLYTLQPSGTLYQGMVESGKSTAVQASTWLDQAFNLVFIGAIYGPTHQVDQVQKGLLDGVEKQPSFSDNELQRVKNITKNQAETIQKSATALGSRLSDYVVAYQGDWTKYFQDLDDVQKIKVEDVNKVYADFLTPEHRITAQILPTPEDQKKAQQQQKTETTAKTLEVVAPEALKDPLVYQQETQQYLKDSQHLLKINERKIKRGKLKNGAAYALYKTETKDDKVYAAIDVNFGTAESLKNKSEIIGLTAYLLLRGSEQYSLQNIMDTSIAKSASSSVSSAGNGMRINISAKKENFAEYFDFIMQVLKHPSFEQSQFDLIRSQSLASLDRPYTEPDIVAGLTLARTLERYPVGDLRYHTEPTLAKVSYEQATRQDIVTLYENNMGMQHAFIAVTGEFDVAQMKKTLEQQLGTWTSQANYRRLESSYVAYPAQKIHALAEQREFGSYQSVLTFPVGISHPDMAALQVFRHILADSQLSSRLAKELREKGGLVYGVSGNVNFNTWENAGNLSITANYSAGKSEQVSQAVHKVLNDMIQQGITEQELAEAKSSMMKKRVTALEDERRIHGMLTYQLEKGEDLNDRRKRDQAIANLSQTDVNNAIKKHIQLSQFVEVMADQYGQAQPEYQPK